MFAFISFITQAVQHIAARCENSLCRLDLAFEIAVVTYKITQNNAKTLILSADLHAIIHSKRASIRR